MRPDMKNQPWMSLVQQASTWRRVIKAITQSMMPALARTWRRIRNRGEEERRRRKKRTDDWNEKKMDQRIEEKNEEKDKQSYV